MSESVHLLHPNAGSSSKSQASAYTWLLLYFVCNLTLTIYNKAVMQWIGFHFPWSLTAVHTTCSAIGCWICVHGFRMFSPARLNREESMVMLWFSVLYTINIAVSNVSLNMVTVPFHQVVRATTPVFTIIMSLLFLNKHYSFYMYLSLLPVVLGVGLATLGEYDYTALGFFLTLLGTFLAALKTLVTNVVQVGRLKLHPMDLLLRMSPLASMQCFVYAWLGGELPEIQEWMERKMTSEAAMALLFNGFIAFLLNVVSFTANKKTSALTMTVAANVKQVLSIILAVMMFNLTITATNALGILLTIIGGAIYGWLEAQEKLAKASSTLPFSKDKNMAIIPEPETFKSGIARF